MINLAWWLLVVARESLRWLVRRVWSAVRAAGAIGLHEAALLRLRGEAGGSLIAGKKQRNRVLATACWRFPIYSQTFVYRELAELASQGFELRFVYSELASRSELAVEAGTLWRLRRKLVLSDAASARDLGRYRRRMPERVDALVRMVSEASGLSAAEVLAHPHFRHAFSFTRMAECWRADYLHSYFFYERTVFTLVASYLLNIPRGVSCYADHMLQDYPLKMMPLHLRTCDVIVATSARIRHELETLAQRPLAEAVVKPNAIDVRQFAAPERRREAPDRVWKLTSVSRIHPKKGITHLIDAAVRLRKLGLQILLRIVGEADPHDPESQAYAETVRQQIVTHGLEDTVRLEGRKTSPEVREYLLDADIFVAPFVELPNGDKDGIPTALLEAMAAGCGIVSTDAGSIAEVIEDGREALIVPQGDAGALADAIVRLMQDGNLRARLARGAVERVSRDFDISRCETAFHQRVQAAIAGAGAGAGTLREMRTS